MVLCGIAGSTVVGIMQGRRMRIVPGSQAAFISSRLGMFYGVLYGFVILWLIVFPLDSTTGLNTLDYRHNVQIYLRRFMVSADDSYCAWCGGSPYVVIGYYLVPHYFWLWSAVFAGLPLICRALLSEAKITMASLNEIIHQPVRLRIMAMLVALPPETQMKFALLKEALELTDGNLGAHLHKLEEADYLTITKTFVRNKPQTYIQATEAGRNAFLEHRNALREILESSRQVNSDGGIDSTKGHLL